MAVLYGAVLYHYCVENYGDYQYLTPITATVRCHYILGRLAVLGGLSFYSYSLYNSGLAKSRIFWVRLIKVLTWLMLICVSILFAFGIVGIFKARSWLTVRQTSLAWKLMPFVQFSSGAFLTVIKLTDLARSNAFSVALSLQNHPLRAASSLLCLACQTAIFPTAFDIVSMCMIRSHHVGVAYTILSLSAQLHLFGPIIAISASLDDSLVVDQSSSFSAGKNDPKGRDTPKEKQLAFLKQEKPMSEY